MLLSITYLSDQVLHYQITDFLILFEDDTTILRLVCIVLNDSKYMYTLFISHVLLSLVDISWLEMLRYKLDCGT